MIIPEMYAHSSPCPYSIDGGPEDRRCTCGLDDLMEELDNYALDYRDPQLKVYRAAPVMYEALVSYRHANSSWGTDEDKRAAWKKLEAAIAKARALGRWQKAPH